MNFTTSSLAVNRMIPMSFLMYLLAWLHEDLRGGSLPACLGGGLTSHHVAAAGSDSEPSIITILFQGKHKRVIFLWELSI